MFIPRRQGDSEFLNSLDVSKRGIVKTASKVKESLTAKTAGAMIVKIVSQEALPDDVVERFAQKLANGEDPDAVVKEFIAELEGLKKKADEQAKFSLRTARTLRQGGFFKRAERDVYQNLDSGDFWKLSEDKSHIERCFEEKDGGVDR